MNSEISQILNQNLLAPFIFIVMCSLVFITVSAVLYNLFLRRWISEKLAIIAIFAGIAYILITCVKNYERVKDLVASWNVTTMSIVLISFIVLIGVVARLIPTKKKREIKETKRKSISNKKSERPRSLQSRPDEEILNSPFEHLSGTEFERLLALYFRDQGYIVHEVGIGGNDGGVDLVIIDKSGEKTAVQAKCYAEHNLVGVQVVRELVGAKRNHDCILTLLITTSDLTGPAKKEAEQFKVDYWHGGIVEQKLNVWGKWKPENKKSKQARISAPSQIKIAQKQVAASTDITCSCGAPMIKRVSKDGKPFIGCTTFPKCRQTRSI